MHEIKRDCCETEVVLFHGRTVEVAVAHYRCIGLTHNPIVIPFLLLNAVSIFLQYRKYKYFRFSTAMLDLTVQNNSSGCRSTAFVYVFVYKSIFSSR